MLTATLNGLLNARISACVLGCAIVLFFNFKKFIIIIICLIQIRSYLTERDVSVESRWRIVHSKLESNWKMVLVVQFDVLFYFTCDKCQLNVHQICRRLILCEKRRGWVKMVAFSTSGSIIFLLLDPASGAKTLHYEWLVYLSRCEPCVTLPLH